MGSAGDWGDIIDTAEAERFVGREQELQSFRQEISRPHLHYVIFFITGQGGVGKTTLLNRYREIASKDFNFLLADSDEQQRDIPTVLGRFAQQLAEQGFPLKRFNERYKTYRQKMHEIENDPEAPQGLAGLLGRTVVRAALVGGDLVPGVRKGIELLPRDTLETQASDWASYLAKKLTNKDDVVLIRDPVPILTPLFFEDANAIAQQRRILLCFENFEVTREELQQWLARIREYRPSQNIRVAIASRDEPGPQWDTLRNVTLTIHLDVLTEQEAEKFLDAYGVTNVRRRAEILECSGRLPVIMSWLAAPEGNETDIALPAQDIVERFLRWISDQKLRQTALAGAIPRTFNADVLNLLLRNQNDAPNGHHSFDWLLTMPFVKQRSDSWYYHEVVRRLMLDDLRKRSPKNYQEMHTILANFYDATRNEHGLSEDERWTNRQWRKETLAYCYHHLVVNPTRHWGDVMNIFALAIRKRRAFAVELIDLLRLEDVQDELSSEQNAAVQLFYEQLQAIKDQGLQSGLTLFDKLCQIDTLSPEAKGYMLAYRGESHRMKGDLEPALLDLDAALQLIPKDVRTIIRRAIIYVMMRRYDEAALDLQHAISLDEKDAWAYGIDGEMHRRMKRYDEALADLNKAIALDEKHSWAFAMRGETYWEMGLLQEALADFDRSIALDDKYTWAINRREEILRLVNHPQAISPPIPVVSPQPNLSLPYIPSPTYPSSYDPSSQYPTPPIPSPQQPYGTPPVPPSFPPIPPVQGYSNLPIPPVPPLPETSRPPIRLIFALGTLTVVLVILVILVLVFHIV